MSSLRDIKRRIKSVKSTQQITKAMKMVAAAKLKRAQENIVAARPYAEKMQEMITSISSKLPSDKSHPLFTAKEEGKTEVVLITSDRGLCGGFNGTLIRLTEKFIRENTDKELIFNFLGKRGGEYFKRRDIEIAKSMPLGNKNPGYALASEIARDIISSYERDEDNTNEVYVIYSQFQSALVQTPTIQKILPMEPEEGETEDQRELLFEPSPMEVLDSLLPKYVEGQIFRALLESAASEHGARMTSMDSASKNASSMIDSLTLQYNRVRQAAITKELMEIISGSEAVK
ncbi:MAG: ATP synthase F1 subunit gamma [Proteobacteria bacterium]|nr:ATP synthase F1 subunit gamma [Pseudomonadota bacterium]